MTLITWCLLQFSLFLLFSSYIIFYKFLIILSHILSRQVVLPSLSLSISLSPSSFFIIFCNFTLYWWIVVIFKALSLSLSHSFGWFDFVWFNAWLFWKYEFKFISKYNPGYTNNRLTFGPFQFILVHVINSVRFGLLQSTSVHFSSIESIQSTSINLVLFDLFQSNSVHSFYLDPICPI